MADDTRHPGAADRDAGARREWSPPVTASGEERFDRDPVDRPIVKAHIVAGLIALAIGIATGLAFSFQLIQAYWFPGVEWLSPGRVRMLHTNVLAYGFIANVFIGGLYWAVPRITGRTVASRKLSWIIFWTWQGILVATAAGILGGLAQGIEWGETPIFIDPVVVVGLILVALNFLPPIIRSGGKPLYVSLWYFTAGLIWTLLNYIMGNYVPQFFLPGASGAAVAGLFIHDLVGLFVTPLGWGLMYYFVPTILRKPIWSHAISLIGFWGLAFFYPLNGVHHFLWSPIPMFAQYGAVVATVGVEIVVTTVFINFLATIRGSGSALATSLPIRWMYTGIFFYVVTCFQCSIQVLLTVQKVIHFTDWVVGHAHLVMFGVFGFWIFGIVLELWPKLTGRAWYSTRLNTWHYWLTAVGTAIMVIDLTAAGLVQGFLWRDLAPWEASLVGSYPFWLVRTVTGVLIAAGQVAFFVNLWLTARRPAATT
ncbi:MAG: cbb3-type cytochrome c oxidase subunit I [Acidobacteria bacterium]|nr:cbb3-type cytochrome c oxidase subunit I [Acidobacteriota bacterium]